MLVLYGLDKHYDNGYIKDYLPENTEVVIDSVQAEEVYNHYNVLPNAVSVETKVEDGKKVAYFNFSPELIKYLEDHNDKDGSLIRSLPIRSPALR